MPKSRGVSIQYFRPSAQLQRYFTAFFLTEVSLPEGETVSDLLMPTWGVVNFFSANCPEIETLYGERMSGSNFIVAGPSTNAAHLTVGRTRHWGLAMLPAGWARFVSAPAADFANMSVDGYGYAAFGPFKALADIIFSDAGDAEEELARIENHLLHCPHNGSVTEERIVSISKGLQDRSVRKVTELADYAGTSPRTVERLCKRAFGFPPKLLLRRQRFLRSLTYYELEPSARWTHAMDDSYHDQSHFVREFRQFMGMSPREYASIERPFAVPIAKVRAQYVLNEAQDLPDQDN